MDKKQQLNGPWPTVDYEMVPSLWNQGLTGGHVDPSEALSLMPQHGGEEWSPHVPSSQSRIAMVSDHGLPLSHCICTGHSVGNVG